MNGGVSPHPRLSRDRAIVLALASALLFGASTPLAKRLLEAVDAWMLAGILYLGSGVGLLAWRAWRTGVGARLAPGEAPWLAAAIACGGVLAPVLLLSGLAAMPASTASLLLNAEGVLTALLAWFVFKENFDRRIAAGMVAIVAGAVVLSWPDEWRWADVGPTLLVLGACLAWAVDNNLTRKVETADASFVAMSKGLAAGLTNVTIALASGAAVPAPGLMAAGAVVGALGYGLSLVLFVLALRGLGTARTGAYFSVAPFFGALIAVAWLGEPLGARLAAAAALMGLGVWLHVTERHAHEHTHEPLQHEHEHRHDDAHHEHEHEAGAPPLDARGRHRHAHQHHVLTHSHAHFPDIHHRHGHAAQVSSDAG